MARLVLEDTTYVDVALGVVGRTGALRDVYDPASSVEGALTATSQRKLGKVSLYGHFGYGYDYGCGSTWRGWIDPYETPFMLADSIPGSLSLERYSLEAGAGLPLSDNWSLGVDVAYDVALMAKHKDLRNKNTAMTFRVAPGIHWHNGGFGLGLDVGYERGTERVEYTQVSSSQEHVLFDLYGLWLYHASGFASAEDRRFKENERFFGDVQFDLERGRVALHNNLGVSWKLGSQTEVGYNNQQFGTTRSLTWQDELSLQIGSRHTVEASFEFSSMQGFRPLQRQELDPDSRIRVWVTCGDPVFCYWRQYHVETLRYTFGSTWKLQLGAVNWGMEHAYTEYPHRFVQRISTVAPTLGVAIPLGRFELAPEIGYALDYGAFNEVSQWQLAEPLLRQWDYWDGNSYLGALGLHWVSATGRTSVRARYDFEASTAADADGFRHSLALTVGFVF